MVRTQRRAVAGQIFFSNRLQRILGRSSRLASIGKRIAATGDGTNYSPRFLLGPGKA
jgi:hypothetical protein